MDRHKRQDAIGGPAGYSIGRDILINKNGTAWIRDAGLLPDNKIQRPNGGTRPNIRYQIRKNASICHLRLDICHKTTELESNSQWMKNPTLLVKDEDVENLSNNATAAARNSSFVGNAAVGSPFARNACMKMCGACLAMELPGNARIAVTIMDSVISKEGININPLPNTIFVIHWAKSVSEAPVANHRHRYSQPSKNHCISIRGSCNY